MIDICILIGTVSCNLPNPLPSFWSFFVRPAEFPTRKVRPSDQKSSFTSSRPAREPSSCFFCLTSVFPLTALVGPSSIGRRGGGELPRLVANLGRKHSVLISEDK